MSPLPPVPFGLPVAPPPEPDALSRQSECTPAFPPDTLIVPAMMTVPVARRSSTPDPLVVTVTPAGTLIVVKLCTPGESTVLVVGLNAPSALVLGKRVHTPPWHTAPVGHTAPHVPPQLVDVSRSQPFASFMSQLAKPVRHATSRHVPDVHAPTPLANVHARPHIPQLLTSVWRSRHVPVQLVCPAPHVTTQLLPEHTCPAEHIRPHIPQWLVSVVRSRHVPEQLVWPVGHVTWHIPDVHAWPDAQTLPHMPQLVRSFTRSRHVPEQLV
jgi:hypothetical protein